MKYTAVVLTFFIELQFYANLRHATGKNSYFVFYREIHRFLNYKLSVPACCLQFPRCLSTGETAIALVCYLLSITTLLDQMVKVHKRICSLSQAYIRIETERIVSLLRTR